LFLTPIHIHAREIVRRSADTGRVAGNNVYIFPPLGLAAILSRATCITQNMIYASAVTLAESLTADERARGMLYPEIMRIRSVTPIVARGVIRAAQADGVDREARIRPGASGASGMSDAELEGWIRQRMYDPFEETKRVEMEIEAMREGNGAEEGTANGRSVL